MRLLDKYILKAFVGPFLFGVFAFTSIFIGTGTLFRIAQYITEYGAPLLLVMQAFVLALPSIVILTFPMSVLDPIAVADIQQIILHVKNRGIGILITDHNVRETLGIVDKAYILSNGKILLEGTPDEIANDPIAREHYLGDNFKL